MMTSAVSTNCSGQWPTWNHNKNRKFLLKCYTVSNDTTTTYVSKDLVASKRRKLYVLQYDVTSRKTQHNRCVPKESQPSNYMQDKKFCLR